ncbi:MAG: hypothetical protein R2800_08180 [Flavipsychrobacter sp.]
MLHYESFELAMLQLKGDTYKEWEHLLPFIPADLRYRYINAVKKGFSMPQAFDLVLSTTTVADHKFELLLQMVNN